MSRSSQSWSSHVKVEQGRDILFAQQKKGQLHSLPVNCKLFVPYFLVPLKVRNRSICISASKVKEKVSLAKITCPVLAPSTRDKEQRQLTFIVNNCWWGRLYIVLNFTQRFCLHQLELINQDKQEPKQFTGKCWHWTNLRQWSNARLISSL